MFTRRCFLGSIAFLFAFLNSAFPQHSVLYINEFMASNVLAFDNNNSNYADWIEIYNSGNTPIDLAGYSLTDNPGAVPYRQIPSGQSLKTTVPAKGYLLLFADESTELGADHLDFKLNHQNGRIALIGTDGTTVLDSLSYPVQFRDISYGRYPDSGEQLMYMSAFTPGTSNHQGYPTYVSPPTINPGAGFYTSVSVSIQPAAAGDTIRYMLDGSDPDDNSPRYTTPLAINQTSIVKARSFRSGSLPSQIETEAILHDTHTLPVMALITDPDNLYDPATGIYVNDKDGRAWERSGELEYFDSGSLSFDIPAGLRIQGNTGPVDFNKKSFRAYFRKGYGSERLVYPLFPGSTVTSFSELVLRSGYDDDIETKNSQGTLLRDPLVSTLWQRIGGFTPQDRFAVLYLNNGYHGIYDLKESVDKNFICDHTGYQDIDLIRTRWDSLELQHGDKVKWNEMVDFFRSNSFTSDSKLAEAAGYLDLDDYMNLQILVHATEYMSWAYGVFAFREISSNARWQWTIWDADRACTDVHWNGLTTRYNLIDIYLDSLITKKLLQNQKYKINFINRTADLLNTTFSPASVKAIIDSLAGNIEGEIPREGAKWGTSLTKWNENVNFLRSFADQRPSIVRDQIQNFFSLSGQANLALQISGKGKLVVNTITIDNSPWSGKYFRGIPVTVTAIPDPGYRFTGWGGTSGSAEKTVTLNLSGDTTLSAVFAEVGNSNAELIVPKRINSGSVLPIVVRIRNAYGEINPIDQTPIAITFGGAHSDTTIAIKRGAGTGIVRIDGTTPFQISVQNANVPVIQKQISISSIPSVSYSGTRPDGDEVWDNTADRLITADVTIPAGCHLTIQKGTHVIVKKYVNLHVKGAITVQGTAEEPVLVTSENWSEPWGGMDFDNATANFEYCMVLNGGGDLSKGQPTPGEGWHTGHQHIFFGKNNSVFTFNQCFFLYSPGKVFGMQDGIATLRNSVSSFVWHGGEFHRVLLRYEKSHLMNFPDDNNASYTEDIDTDGLHIDYLNPLYPQYSVIDSCFFITGKDDAIDHHFSRLKISNCWLEEFVHEGVAASGGDTVKIFNTLALNNDQGFEGGWTEGSANGPYIFVDHCVAVGNRNGLRIGDDYYMTYRDFMKVTNSIVYNNQDNICNFLYTTQAPLAGAIDISYSMTNDSAYNASPFCITGVPQFDAYYYLIPGSPGSHRGMRGSNMGRADSSAFTVGSVVINEIMYKAPSGMDSKDWVELYNSQKAAQDISGWIVKDDNNTHAFVVSSGTTLPPKGYWVVCEDTVEFKHIYPGVHTITGNIPFGFGGNDQVRLYTPEGQLVDSIPYNNLTPWPAEADGDGYSIVLLDPTRDHTLPANWARSGQFGGSPGMQNTTTGIEQEPGSDLPTHYVLEQNYPNPFNGTTMIRFSVPQNSRVDLEVFDILGRRVATLLSGQLTPGRYTMPWKPENISSGVFLYRIRAGNFISVKKLLLLK